MINQTLITDLKFPCLEKIARVTPVFKKEDRMKKGNYMPISVLNVFSKVFERFLLNQMVPYLDNVLSTYLSAYRKGYSCQNVLLKLIEKWRQCLEKWRQCLDQNKVVVAILIDLSKAFDALPHDLLIAKLNAYGFSNQALKIILSYLRGRKQRVKNKSLSFLRLIKSGVPQGSILGPVLFNIFLNDIFLMLNDPDLHNFADDNTLSAVGETIQGLVDIMQHKAESAISWMEENDMIANPDKFKAIIITKERQQTENYELNFKGKSISSSAKVDLLGITIDNKLSFEFHISEICRKAGGQLNALKRLGSYLPLHVRKVDANSFILSHFNYCPLVWYFSTAKQIQKIEKIHERVVRFIHDDYHSDYVSLLLSTNSSTMEVRRMRALCVEIYKTLNNLNPDYMKDIFVKPDGRHSSRRPLNISVPRVHQATFGLKSIRYEGAKLWNSLPESIKSAENLERFKRLIANWEGPQCNCSSCGFLETRNY